MTAFDQAWAVVKVKIDECKACGKQDDINYTSSVGNWKMCWNCNETFCPECVKENISPCANCEDTFCNECLSLTTNPESKHCQGCIDYDTVGTFGTGGNSNRFQFSNKSDTG
jgi:hypothetical protein